MSLSRVNVRTGEMLRLGASRNLALYTGVKGSGGEGVGTALADQYANPSKNPWKPSVGAPPVLVWLPDDAIVEGQIPSIRRHVYEEPAHYMVRTLLPVLDGLELVNLEVRLIHDSRRLGVIPNLTLSVGTELPGRTVRYLESLEQVWSAMKLANNLVVRNPNLAASKLEHLASRIEANQTWAAMARRNQAVALIAAGEGDRALQVLLDGKERYPGYRDFDFVLIWLLLQINEVDMAEAMLESLKLEAESDYVHGYQRLGATTRWLKSRLEQRKGRPDYAAMHLSAALQSDGWRPVYLEDLTRLGVPGRHLRSLLPVLSQVCWKNPHQVPAVSTLLSDAGLHAELEALHQNLLIPQSIRHDLVNSTRPGPDGQIRLEGEFTARHSLSRINRTLALWLDRHGYPLEIAPSNYPTQENEVHPEIAPVLPLLAKPLGRPAITVRHGWPHDFTPVGTGKLVMMFPWEYGSIPREWARGLAEADEIWVLTHYVRDVLVANGLDPGKIAIVPAGVDPALFRPEGHAKQFAGAKGFTFLFVGGTILRKGVDLLVEAYCQEFGPNEDVTLVIKDFGAGSIYTDTLLEAIELRALQPGTPHILINRDTFSDEDLAALYRGCGALVHPYRGEGFGMPIAEAMACGAPVVVTGAGACLDFCNDEVAYLVPAEEVMAGETALEHLGPMVQAPTWFEVQVEDLRRQMRHIYENREEARHKGQKAARFITENFTWDHAFARAGERLRTLLARQ